MKKSFLYIFLCLGLLSSCTGPKDGTYTLQLLTTNDVHGSWFDSTYTGGRIRPSLMAVNYYADSVRRVNGAENVIMIDAGDCLQGDNAAYYYNYVDTLTPHLYPRIASYMKYDAVVVGNHDIEPGHKVYDRVSAQLKDLKIPFLAGNAIRSDNGKPYFPMYTCLKRNGLKICVLGFTNPNMKEWLDDSLWTGMEFKSLLPLVQEDVDKVIAKEKPHVVIVAVHSGTGTGDGQVLENQGLDLMNSLSGVDFLVCSHDHRAVICRNDAICLINSGSHAENVGHGTIQLSVKNGEVVTKTVSGELIKVDPKKADSKMRDFFAKDYEAVKAFTMRKVGSLSVDMRTRDAFKGMSLYMDLIHSVSLSCEPALVSFAAPLTYNGFIKSGDVLFNDLFTIYPYENQLYVVTMKGDEIRKYLEYSYDQWIQTFEGLRSNVLRIEEGDDGRSGHERWHFVNRSYNFDSAGGLDYVVDITKPFGSRVLISSLADGRVFYSDSTYNVAMTSYRASGGGGLLEKGAGVDTDRIQDRVVAKYPEIRSVLYDYIAEHKTITAELISNPSVVGKWEFIPEKKASKSIDRDFDLLFGKKDRK